MSSNIIDLKYFYTSLVILLYFTTTSIAQTGPSSELIEFNTTCKVVGKTLSKEIYKVIKVNRREGEENARIYIPYSKGDNVTQLKAWITNEKGKRIRNLSSKYIEDRSAISDISFYEDDFVKEINLVETKYPYYLHCSYVISYKQFFNITYWDPVIDLDCPTHHATLTVDVPKDYPIRIFEDNIEAGNKVIEGKRAIYTWSSNYLEQLEPETYAPHLSQFLPRVNVIPEAFDYGEEGSHESWQTIGKWINALSAEGNELPEAEINKIKQLTADLKDPRAKAKALYYYLQDNTRYINVAMDVGGFKPYPASYVAEKKYGDCKALSNYLQASLAAIDIPSYYTVIYAGNRIKQVNKDFPSQQFNHAFLMVPIESDTLWLECTSNISPFAYMGTFTQNRNALVVEPNNARLVKTPALQPEEVLVNNTIHFQPTSNNACVANLTAVMKGRAYERFNSLQENASQHRQEQIIKDILLFNNYQVKDWSLEKHKRDEAAITLKAEVELANYLKKYGNMLVASLSPLPIPNFEKPKERQLPVQLDYPIYQVDTLIYKIPTNYISKAPKSTQIDNQYGTYRIDHELKDTHVLVIRSFLLHAGHYPVADYSDFYDFLQQVRLAEREQNVIFKKE